MELWCNQEARAKDKLEMTLEPDLNVRGFLETAYLHPAIKAALADNSPSLGKGGIHNLLESGHSQTTQIVPFQSKSLHDTPRKQDCNSIVSSQSALLVPKSRWKCRRVIHHLGVPQGDFHVTLAWAWPWSMWMQHMATFFPNIINFVSTKTTTPYSIWLQFTRIIGSDPYKNHPDERRRETKGWTEQGGPVNTELSLELNPATQLINQEQIL